MTPVTEEQQKGVDAFIDCLDTDFTYVRRGGAGDDSVWIDDRFTYDQIAEAIKAAVATGAFS